MHQADVASVPLVASGEPGASHLDFGRLEELLARRRPVALYTMPTFQNPTGLTQDAETRSRLAALCREAGTLIVEDDYESETNYIGKPTPALKSMDRDGRVRAIAEGTGSLGTLEIRHVSATTDIRVGDLLETSGLGERFPGGYPVAVVTAIERNPGKMFAHVVARPSAALDRSRHVLLVFSTHANQGS